MYQPIDRQAGASALPTSLPNPVELVLFRSYQTPGIAGILYYMSYLVAVMFFVNKVYRGAKFYGAGGAVLGTFTGLLYAIVIILVTRVFLEACMALIEMREGHRASPAVPAPHVAPVVAPQSAPGFMPTTTRPEEQPPYQAATYQNV